MANRAERERKKLGGAIRVVRERLKLQQADLAAAAEMKQPEISKLESGRRGLSPFQLSRIAQRLGLTVEALLALADGRRVRGPRRSGVEDVSKPHQ